MDIELLTRFFMWCTILNFGLLIVSFLFLAFANDFVCSLHGKWFAMSRETFNVVIYAFIGLYKIAWLVLCFVPWVALLIIAQHAPAGDTKGSCVWQLGLGKIDPGRRITRDRKVIPSGF